MDQLRKILGWIRAQHFWLLCGLAAAIALFCWNSARGKLAKEFEANKSAIETEFGNEKGLLKEAFHANDEIIARQQQEIDEQAKSVEATWKQLYDRQKKEVLAWPDALTKEFHAYVEKKKFGDDIPRDLRTNYQNYADRHFESLPKIVGARVMRLGEGGMGGSSAFGGRGEMMSLGRPGFGREGGESYAQPTAEELAESQEDYLCEWLDQMVVRDALEFRERPSSWKIWVTQEDLWVYHTLLRIIANTNEAAGADRMTNAAIRTIMQLQVGQPAGAYSRAKGRIEIALPPLTPDAMVAGGEAGGAPTVGMPPGGGDYGRGPGPGMRMGGEYGPGGGATQMTPEQEQAMLLAGRYLDADGKPIGGADLGMEAAATDPSAAPPQVELDKSAPFKRLPVRMVLQMDQRWIAHLICECANQPLQVEVTEVRINPPDAGAAGGGSMAFDGGYGGGGGYGSGGYGSSRGPGAREGGGGGGYGGSTTSTLQVHTAGQLGTFSQQPNLATVVIQGMIYIFQEPNKEALPKPEEQVVTNDE